MRAKGLQQGEGVRGERARRGCVWNGKREDAKWRERVTGQARTCVGGREGGRERAGRGHEGTGGQTIAEKGGVRAGGRDVGRNVEGARARQEE